MTVELRSGKPERQQGLWLRQVESENAVLDPTNETVHLLNDTALAIWHLCDGRTSPAEMVEAICEVTRLPVEIVSEDVVRILEEFDQVRLLVWVD